MIASELAPEQLDELHQDLLQERQRLEVSLQLTVEGAKPVELSTPIGRLSRMDAIQQQQMTKAGRSTSEGRLRLIRAALGAVTRGEYGSCRSCEHPIGYPRLKARPEALLCLSCQDSRES